TAAHGLTGSQVTSIITVLVCVWHMVFVRRTPRWGRWDELPPKGEPPESDPSPDVDANDGTVNGPTAVTDGTPTAVTDGTADVEIGGPSDEHRVGFGVRS